jgi:hypothetical protein
VKEIPLSRGLVALVDDEDYAVLSRHKWSACPRGYARRRLKNNENPTGKFQLVYMHRVLMQLTAFDGKQVDHIDGNKANNRRSNLRLCNPSQNHANVGPNKRNKSGYKGVCFHKRFNKWTASIAADGKIKHLGYFSTPEAANTAYCDAAKIYQGEFAHSGVTA